jgi:hypothetical protein
VRSFLTAALLLASLSCAAPESPPASPGRASVTTSTQPAASAPVTREAPAALPPGPLRLQVRGASFVRGAAPFEWRGITAFRLVEQVAHGREPEALAYLDWARGQRLTVVRVLVMAKHLFELSPDDGVKALPRVLTLAGERGLVVEVVALADTADIKIDLEQHVKAVAAIAAVHPNAVLEIANEPVHPTQDRRLHDPAFVKALANLVPADVPVALGAGDGDDEYAAGGRYATWHSPRSSAQEGWGHVLEISKGAGFVVKLGKPLINDEPIGAAEAAVPGRRDNDPRRFAGMAVLGRLAGLGATFHYEGGLQARVPAGRELACFSAWNEALDALSRLPDGGRFLEAGDVERVAAVEGTRAVLGREYDQQAWIAAVDPSDPSIRWQPPWHEIGRQRLPGVVLLRGSRRP